MEAIIAQVTLVQITEAQSLAIRFNAWKMGAGLDPVDLGIEFPLAGPKTASEIQAAANDIRDAIANAASVNFGGGYTLVFGAPVAAGV